MAETASDPASTFYRNLRLKIMIVDLIGYGAPVFFAIYLTLNFHEKILEIIQNNNINSLLNFVSVDNSIQMIIHSMFGGIFFVFLYLLIFLYLYYINIKPTATLENIDPKQALFNCGWSTDKFYFIGFICTLASLAYGFLQTGIATSLLINLAGQNAILGNSNSTDVRLAFGVKIVPIAGAAIISTIFGLITRSLMDNIGFNNNDKHSSNVLDWSNFSKTNWAKNIITLLNQIKDCTCRMHPDGSRPNLGQEDIKLLQVTRISRTTPHLNLYDLNTNNEISDFAHYVVRKWGHRKNKSDL
ncbi:MAG TPA: hypothetical protein DCL95_02995 [Rhodospirillaceae bacterium]|nr:hypothetical protein [Rhodospirillaceae bacterium]HAE00031.1 hypothetical protein [Rhodospirillaceae bacterium]HAJ19019.1 hypothetical protein [Rhodospirillaceae bacterium]|tara:strand:+ start:472 stop:1371 length:900 start_codon:yes stop_codon:yes gene_type:complete